MLDAEVVENYDRLIEEGKLKLYRYDLFAGEVNYGSFSVPRDYRYNEILERFQNKSVMCGDLKTGWRKKSHGKMRDQQFWLNGLTDYWRSQYPGLKDIAEPHKGKREKNVKIGEKLFGIIETEGVLELVFTPTLEKIEKKADKEKADKEKADKEKTDKEKADKEKADKEKADKEKADKEKADKENLKEEVRNEYNIELKVKQLSEEVGRLRKLVEDNTGRKLIGEDIRRKLTVDEIEKIRKLIGEDTRRKLTVDEIEKIRKLIGEDIRKLTKKQKRKLAKKQRIELAKKRKLQSAKNKDMKN